MNQELQGIQESDKLKGDEEHLSDVGARDGGPGEWKLSMTATGSPVYDDRMSTLWSVETVYNQGI
jgi:hypothetical protein